MITYSENRVKTHIRKHLCPGGYIDYHIAEIERKITVTVHTI